MNSFNKLTQAECKGFNSTQKYNLLQCEPIKQPLQLLYPGRILEPDYHYTGDNIPNEDMTGLERTRKISRSLAVAYNMEKEALSRHLGGKSKIVPHPAVEPEAIINDPRLGSINLEFGNEDSSSIENYSNDVVEKNPYNNLQEMNRLDRELVNNARREENLLPSKNMLDSNGKLSDYDWGERYRDIYPFIKERDYTYYDNPNDNYYTEDFHQIENFIPEKRSTLKSLTCWDKQKNICKKYNYNFQKEDPADCSVQYFEDCKSKEECYINNPKFKNMGLCSNEEFFSVYLKNECPVSLMTAGDSSCGEPSNLTCCNSSTKKCEVYKCCSITNACTVQTCDQDKDGNPINCQNPTSCDSSAKCPMTSCPTIVNSSTSSSSSKTYWLIGLIATIIIIIIIIVIVVVVIKSRNKKSSNQQSYEDDLFNRFHI